MLIFYLFYFLCLPSFAHAYLDPGTGSLLVYALIGLLTSLAFALRGFWYWILSHLSFGNTIQTKKLSPLVFHSEGGKYWQVFEPIIKSLDYMNIQMSYISPDKNDPALTQTKYKNLTAIHPGNDIVTLSYMNNINADLVVSTTPQLNVMMWKKSKEVKHYTHIFHAPTDIATYEMYAFDHYDSLLLVGEFQKKAVRQIETKRNLKEKQLFITGCTYYDYMSEELEKLKTCQSKAEKSKTCVLYAPAWGSRSSLLKYGKEIITQLGTSSFQVIFRPHPQLYISNKEVIAEIEDLIKTFSNISIDKNRTFVDSGFKSDIMLTDLSGVIFDYAFLYEKPIILFEGHFNFDGFEAIDCDTTQIWDVNAVEKITHKLQTTELQHLNEKISAILEKKNTTTQNILSVKSDIANFGKTGIVAATQIAELLKGI